MIHDVARFARHSRAREDALSRVCAALAGSGRVDDDTARLLASVADNCAARAGLWERRAPDAAYIAVGRPVTRGTTSDPASDPDSDIADDPVLVELAAADGSDITASLRAVHSALTDIDSAYLAQTSAVDARLDPPTADALNGCRGTVSDDRQAVALLAQA